MAKKPAKTTSPASEIRKLLGTKKIVIGTERVMKQLKAGSIEKVFVTSNCPEDIREDISRYARISKAAVVELEMPNDELGIVCKKPFSISIVGIVKG